MHIMKKFLFNALVIIIMSFIPGLLLAMSPEADTTVFVPSGKPILRVFADFTTPIGESSSKTSFEVRRAYLGYDYALDKNWSMKIVLDIGSPNDDSPYSLLKRYAYFKNAALTYHKGNIVINAGIIDLYNVDLPESLWGYRYVYKSFMDEYKFTPRADIGVNALWKIKPYLSVDAMVMNGEGYDQLQNDNTYKTSFGLTVRPLKWLVSRAYTEYSHKKTNETLVSLLLGIDLNKKYAAGFEYNYRFQEKFVEDHDRFGYSVYGRFAIGKKFGVFARYDWVSSGKTGNLDRPWNLAKDGSAMLFGAEYAPISKVRLSLNYQDWYPAAANVDNRRSIFLNLEFRL